MRKVFYMLLMGIVILGLVIWNFISFHESGRSLSDLENTIKEQTSLTHEDLYYHEVQKITFQMKQEPYLQMNQRYSRKMLSDSEISSIGSPKVKIIHKPPPKDVERDVRYHIQRVEETAAQFQQAKIYATVQGHNGRELKAVCTRIREQFREFNSLVICLYDHNEVGIALSQGKQTYYGQQEVRESWLVFYSFHPAEGEYFDDDPGKFLGS